MFYKFSVVLPVQNQEEIIEPATQQIVKVLKKAKVNYQLIMVENGSKDKTLKILKKLAKKNKRIKVCVSKPGYGRAVIYGLKQTEGEYVGYMPSDGQVEAEVLPKVFKAIKKPGVDLVKIVRISRENWLRTYVSWVFNLLTNLLFRLKFKDINGSPTVFAREQLKKLKLVSQDSFIDTELVMKTKYLNWKTNRVLMKNLARTGGKSTVKPTIVFEFLKNMFDWRFGNKLANWKNEIK